MRLGTLIEHLIHFRKEYGPDIPVRAWDADAGEYQFITGFFHDKHAIDIQADDISG